MKVRLRFRCNHKGEQMGYTPGNSAKMQKVGQVKLAPTTVGDDDPDAKEIKEFYNYTPAGQIEFATINQAALAEFEVGQDYYITLERVEK